MSQSLKDLLQPCVTPDGKGIIQQYGKTSVMQKLLQDRFDEFMAHPGTNMRDRILGIVSGYKYCKTCQKNILPYPRQDTLGLYCSKKCMQNDTDFVAEKIKKGRQTLQEKHGVSNAMQLKSAQEKHKTTMQKRYGVDHPSQVKEFHDKAVANTDHQKLYEKAKATMLKTYGEAYAARVPEFVEKQKQTNLDRYGVENALQNPEIMQKAKQTMLEKYGVENALESAQLLEKARQTNLKNRGVEWPSQCEKVRQKAAETNLDLYGVVNPMKSHEIQQKQKETMLQNHGVDHPMKSDHIVSKMKQTSKSNRVAYAKEVAVSFELDPDKVNFGLSNDRTYTKEFMQVMMGESQNIQAVFDVYNQPHSYQILRDLGYEFKNRVTARHQAIMAILDKNGMEYVCNDRTAIAPLELDIYIPSLKTAIEVNGSYWHSDERLSRDYHLNKSRLCRDAGIKLIHLFDWDDLEKIVASVLPKEAINARDCEVKEITAKEANEFCQMYHRQGAKSARHNYGMFHDGVMLMVMTFGDPRFNDLYDWENIRLCTKIGMSVRGGVGKLFDYAKRRLHGSIITYSPIDKGYNTVYEKIGFKKIGETASGYHWVIGDFYLTRYQTQKHKLAGVLGELFNPDLSESENMMAAGFQKVYDCGQEVFVYEP